MSAPSGSARRLIDAAQADPDQLERLLARCLSGEPLDFVIGRCAFMGMEFLGSCAASLHREKRQSCWRRPQWVQMYSAPAGKPARVVDVCCGAGNLAVALAHYVPTARGWATDIAESATATARENARLHGLSDRVTVSQGDLFAPLAGLALDATIDLIVVRNPPYLSTRRVDAEHDRLLAHEPREAFDAGPYGLAIHQRLITQAVSLLAPGGWLLLEFGAGQARQVMHLFQRSGRYVDTRTVCDAKGVFWRCGRPTKVPDAPAEGQLWPGVSRPKQ